MSPTPPHARAGGFVGPAAPPAAGPISWLCQRPVPTSLAGAHGFRVCALTARPPEWAPSALKDNSGLLHPRRLIHIEPTHSLERVSSQNLGRSPTAAASFFCRAGSGPRRNRHARPICVWSSRIACRFSLDFVRPSQPQPDFTGGCPRQRRTPSSMTRAQHPAHLFHRLRRSRPGSCRRACATPGSTHMSAWDILFPAADGDTAARRRRNGSACGVAASAADAVAGADIVVSARHRRVEPRGGAGRQAQPARGPVLSRHQFGLARPQAGDRRRRSTAQPAMSTSR